MEKALEDQDFVVAYNHEGAFMGYALADISPPGIDEVLAGTKPATALGSECRLHAELCSVLSDL